MLVTHDFEEAAALADEIAVLEAGRVVQRGTPGELASRPAAAFVADLVGSVVLTGNAAPRAGGGTEVGLDGGGGVTSTDEAGSRPGRRQRAPVGDHARAAVRARAELGA